LNFLIFEILMLRTLKRIELRQRDKFGRNWSIRSGDIAIFRFGKMATAASWILKFFKILTVRTLKGVKLCHCVKFRRNRSNCGRDMAIFRFLKMAAVCHLGFVV